MKTQNIVRFVAVVATAMVLSAPAAAQTTNTTSQPTIVLNSDAAARLKALNNQLKQADAKLEAQKAKLNRVYRDVSVEVEEQLNNREDSIYLSLLSEKRNIELEIAEVKKTAQVAAAPAASANNSAATPGTAATPGRLTIPSKPSKPTKPTKPTKPAKPSKPAKK